jgi:uncharacterized membrane protein
MNAPQLVPYLLFLHVMGAILAFGPTFAYSIMGAMAGREPQHANFSARQTAAIGNKLVYPLAIFQGITGVLLIWATGISIMSSAWLTLGILLYIIAITYALTIQRTALHRLIELSTPPPAGTPPGPPAAELPATVKKIQRGGMLLGTLVVVIVYLMVVKPTF